MMVNIKYLLPSCLIFVMIITGCKGIYSQEPDTAVINVPPDTTSVADPTDTTVIYRSPDTLILLKPADTLNIELGEVVITGTRVFKRIIDIPYSVVRINNMSYRYDKKAGADDMLSGVPGMFIQSRYGNHDVRISIRGFGSKSNSGIRGIRILLDDIPESEPDGQTRIEAIDFNSIGSSSSHFSIGSSTIGSSLVELN